MSSPQTCEFVIVVKELNKIEQAMRRTFFFYLNRMNCVHFN